MFYFKKIDAKFQYVQDELADSIKSEKQLKDKLDMLEDIPIRAGFYDYSISGTCIITF